MKKIDRILEICQAYESGYSAGRLNLSFDTNNYQDKTDCYYAWMLGHNFGIQTELVDLEEIRPN